MFVNGTQYQIPILKTSLIVDAQGNVLLNSPYYNKGSSFTERERTEFLLDGLLPANVQPLEEQVKRAYQQ